MVKAKRVAVSKTAALFLFQGHKASGKNYNEKRYLCIKFGLL